MEEHDPDLDTTQAFDGVLAKHLRSCPTCRLFVGDDLSRVNWAGVEAVFGPLLAAVPDETIVAVYDDSAFGRGRAGFVVTDRHVRYVQRSGTGAFALEDVVRADTGVDSVRVLLGISGKRTTALELRVDEFDAQQAVATWLSAVASLNRSRRSQRPGAIPTARQALDRLEAMAGKGTLQPSHVDRIVALAQRLRPQGT